MAKTTITQVTDDLDGSSGAMEVSFSYAGVEYTIDLSKKNKNAFEKALKPYVEAASKVPKRSSARRSNRAETGRKDVSAIREWAKSQGLEVSARGRVPKTVVEQYEAAH